MNRITVFLIVVSLAILTQACRKPTSAAQDPAPENPSNQVEPSRATTSEGSYAVQVMTYPIPIPLNEHFNVEVVVRANDDAELPDDLSIEVDADMPSHGHGINTAPAIQSLGAGRFLAEGVLFHMPGEWELYVDVLRGPVRERAVFPLTMR